MMHRDSQLDHIRDVQDDEFLPPLSLWTRLGGFVLVGTLSTVFTLAAVIKYDATVRAPATVRPDGESQVVQAAAEGTVKQIWVKENTIVKPGDAIALIDNSQLFTRRSELQARIQQNQAQFAQIQVELKAQNTEGLSTVQANQAALELARSELAASERLARSGAISNLQLQQKRQAFAVAQAQLQQAQPASSQKVAELIRAQLEIQNQISQDFKDLQQLQTDLKKSVVLAPTAGTILKLNLRNTGQVVRSGEEIAIITPSQAHLVIKAQVAAQDISRIEICKEQQVANCTAGKVQLRISAYPYPDYGTLKGAVRAISSDVIPHDNAVTPGTSPYYELTIQPETPYLRRNDRDYPLQSGMNVTADIISKEETVLTFLLRKTRLLTDL